MKTMEIPQKDSGKCVGNELAGQEDRQAGRMVGGCAGGWTGRSKAPKREGRRCTPTRPETVGSKSRLDERTATFYPNILQTNSTAWPAKSQVGA